MQTNRTHLYRSSLIVATNKFDKVLDADVDVYAAPSVGSDFPNPFIQSEDGSVFRLSLEQLSGVLVPAGI